MSSTMILGNTVQGAVGGRCRIDSQSTETSPWFGIRGNRRSTALTISHIDAGVARIKASVPRKAICQGKDLFLVMELLMAQMDSARSNVITSRHHGREGQENNRRTLLTCRCYSETEAVECSAENPSSTKPVTKFSLSTDQWIVIWSGSSLILTPQSQINNLHRRSHYL